MCEARPNASFWSLMQTSSEAVRGAACRRQRQGRRSRTASRPVQLLVRALWRPFHCLTGAVRAPLRHAALSASAFSGAAGLGNVHARAAMEHAVMRCAHVRPTRRRRTWSYRTYRNAALLARECVLGRADALQRQHATRAQDLTCASLRPVQRSGHAPGGVAC